MWPVVECHGEGLLQVVHASYRIKRVHIHMRIKVLVVYHNSTQSDKMELNVTPPESPDYNYGEQTRHTASDQILALGNDEATKH